jgi:2-polyprenyl-6-methoxyphenol hydroxylase-like FAD-dependent oxidoreductase
MRCSTVAIEDVAPRCGTQSSWELGQQVHSPRVVAIGGAGVAGGKEVFPPPQGLWWCLNKTALGVLESMGLGSLPAGLGVLASSLELAFAGRSTRLVLPGGIALSRTLLDNALVEAAIGKGVDFLPETQGLIGAPGPERREVLLVRGNHDLTAAARVVLVATGLGEARCAVSLLRGTTSQPIHESEPGVPSRPFRASINRRSSSWPSARGYVGLVRVENGSLNVAAALTRATSGLWQSRRCRREDSVGAGFPFVSEFATASWQGTVALTRQTKPLAGERVFLLGDATGYVEPFTGEGMALALMSGCAVEPLARRGIERRLGPALAWAEVHRRLVARRQYLCRGLATVLRHPWLVHASLGLVTRFPLLGGRMIERLNSSPVFSHIGLSHEHDHRRNRHRVTSTPDLPG